MRRGSAALHRSWKWLPRSREGLVNLRGKSKGRIIYQEDHGICLLGCTRDSSDMVHPKGTTITAVQYQEILSDLRAAIHWKKQELRYKNVLLLYDNAVLIWQRQPWHCSGNSDGRFFRIGQILHLVITSGFRILKPTCWTALLLRRRSESRDLFVIIWKTFFFNFNETSHFMVW